mmetsp:Transcript_24073/g.37780  ORF Transcript_24073/g.37780 Transcript_24073/m.37780 type:complete len:147 (-) Transcript_24073:1476-1916(-)
MPATTEELNAFQRIRSGHQYDASADQARRAVHFIFDAHALNGKISKPQIFQIVKDLGLQLSNPEVEVDAIFGFLDSDMDDMISISEFEEALEPTIAQYQEKGWTIDISDIMRDAFRSPIQDEKEELAAVDEVSDPNPRFSDPNPSP